jgi:hypothetical protein
MPAYIQHPEASPRNVATSGQAEAADSVQDGTGCRPGGISRRSGEGETGSRCSSPPAMDRRPTLESVTDELLETLLGCHELAFFFFGGYCARCCRTTCALLHLEPSYFVADTSRSFGDR